MKIVNKPIIATVIFNTNGKIEPVKFIVDDKAVIVEKILETKEENLVGNKRIVFVCQHSGKFIYELKYEIYSQKWYLFKK